MQTTAPKRRRVPASQISRTLPTFRQWYESTFSKRLPIYLRNDIKKTLQKQFENETRSIVLS